MPVSIRAGISYALTEAVDDGHCGLPTEELIPLAENLLEVPQQLIRTSLDLELQDGTVVADQVGETPCVFLAGLHRAEHTIAERLMRLANGTLPWPWIDPDKALPWVEERIGLALAESQVAAVRLALMSKVLVMTGGPGVGKTTIVKAILRILSAKGVRLLLCAPTGRAAKRMAEATGFEAKTIHRLLEVDPKGGGFKAERMAGSWQTPKERSMKRPVAPASASDEQVRALLDRFACPVPFHEVRTRFLGNIATPSMSASPMKVVGDLWGGTLPAFKTIDDASELIGSLIAGLWNRLTLHQDRSAAFRLTRTEVSVTREGLAAIALIRRQELDGFIERLFGKDEIVDLPERAHSGLERLAQMRALFAAVAEFTADESKPGSIKDMEITLRHMREMTKNAEHEMHAIVLACKLARKQMLAGVPANKPTTH